MARNVEGDLVLFQSKHSCVLTETKSNTLSCCIHTAETNQLKKIVKNFGYHYHPSLTEVFLNLTDVFRNRTEVFLNLTKVFLTLTEVSFIHLVVCLTTGTKPALHIVRSRASSFK